MKYKNSKKEKLHYEAVFLHEEKRKEIIDYSNTSIKVIVCQRFELIEAQIRSAEGVTEELKRQNPMEWVRHCNNIRNRAAEIIKQELIYI